MDSFETISADVAAQSLNIRPYTDALRKLGGWEADGDNRVGGCRVVTFKKTIGLRQLRLQLWGDRNHRVSHAYAGSETTHPTEFTSVETMLAAIEVETSRDDRPAHHAATAQVADALVGYVQSLRAQPGVRGNCSADEIAPFILLLLSRAVEAA